MAETVVKYLLKRPEVTYIQIQNYIHIASNIVADAKKIAERNDPKRCTYSEIDVTDSKAVSELVQKN